MDIFFKALIDTWRLFKLAITVLYVF